MRNSLAILSRMGTAGNGSTDRYDIAAHAASKAMTTTFSSSFGLASKLLPSTMRQTIYDIYGLVRLADEIVDTYRQDNALVLLDALEKETYAALQSGYSTNLIVHAFAAAARRCNIDDSLIGPFFTSMRSDLAGKPSHGKNAYKSYIFGSAEVIGLMCLKAFCEGDELQYQHLANGARALGAAFQKVNFLRDLAYDANELGRHYFPNVRLKTFTDDVRDTIVAEIEHDFHSAEPAIHELPRAARPAVMTAYRYYRHLLDKLASTPAAVIAQSRVRIPDLQKLLIMTGTYSKTKLKLLTKP